MASEPPHHPSTTTTTTPPACDDAMDDWFDRLWDKHYGRYCVALERMQAAGRNTPSLQASTAEELEPSRDTDALASSPATTDISPELAAPVVSDGAHDIVTTDDTNLAMAMPTTCSMSGPDHSTDGADPPAVSLIPWGAPTAVTARSEASPTPSRRPFTVLRIDTLEPTRCSMKGSVEVTYKLTPVFTLGVSLGSPSTTNPRVNLHSNPTPLSWPPWTALTAFRTAEGGTWPLPAPSRPPDPLGSNPDQLPSLWPPPSPISTTGGGAELWPMP